MKPTRVGGIRQAGAVSVCGLHVAAVMSARWMGVSIHGHRWANHWDWFWQTLPVESLRDDLFASLWHLHSQPPLFNLLGGVLIKTFGDAHLDALYGLNVLLGTALCYMSYDWTLRESDSVWLAAGVGVLVALNPALILYETFILYSLIVAFTVLLAVYCAKRFEDSERRLWLYSSMASLVALTLTRSAYHLVLLVPAMSLLIAAAVRFRRQAAVIALCLAAIPTGWYAKNWMKFGFFGSSSLGGFSAWRIASLGYNESALGDLAADGVIEPVTAEVRALAEPSEYRDYGFNLDSAIDVLGRNDYNNINIPEVAQVYGRSAVDLILRDPFHYCRNVLLAYLRFSSPSSSYGLLDENAARMGPWSRSWRSFVELEWATRTLVGIPFNPLFAILMPASLLVLLLSAVKANAAMPFRWGGWVRSNLAMSLAWQLILYTSLVSSLVEYGENERFRFLIEAPTLTIIALCLSRSWRTWQQPSRAPDSPSSRS